MTMSIAAGIEMSAYSPYAAILREVQIIEVCVLIVVRAVHIPQ